MGGWSSLISPQIGCSIISNVIKISWGWHGEGKRILMLGHLFLFEAPYHTNDEWNDSAVCSGCGAVSKWVTWHISQIHLRIWAQKAASFQSISCVLEAGVLGTQVGSLINRGWLIPTVVALTLMWCWKSAPAILINSVSETDCVFFNCL